MVLLRFPMSRKCALPPPSLFPAGIALRFSRPHPTFTGNSSISTPGYALSGAVARSISPKSQHKSPFRISICHQRRHQHSSLESCFTFQLNGLDPLSLSGCHPRGQLTDRTHSYSCVLFTHAVFETPEHVFSPPSWPLSSRECISLRSMIKSGSHLSSGPKSKQLSP